MTLAIAAPTANGPRRAAKKPRPPAEPAKPFTLAHFREWAAGLILDNEQPWRLEPFQESFIEDVFSGVPECWLIVPEGNGKTTLVAGLALYHTEFRPFASVPIAASSREQAEIMYRQAEGFVLRSPRLYEPVHSDVQAAKGKRKTEVPRFLCLEGYRRINHHGGGRIQVFAADDGTGDGVIPTLGIIDELHRHKDLALYRTWSGKLKKRGGQIVTISTAGEPDRDFETTRQKIRQASKYVTRKASFVRAESARVVLHEWAVPEGANVEDLTIVKAANPFSGVTRGDLKDKFESPTMTMEHWKRFVCNVPTRGATAAITEGEWAAAAVKQPIPKDARIWLGLDVAWKWDTTAAVPLWWKSPEHRQFGKAEVLVPPRDGSMLDGEKVKAALRAINERNPVDTCVMDVSRAEEIASWLETELGVRVIDRGQSNERAAQDYEQFMTALRNGWLKHSNDPALTSHVMNAIARTLSPDATRFDRPSSTRHSPNQDRLVIDALVSGAMVHNEAAINSAPVTASVYETRGLAVSR